MQLLLLLLGYYYTLPEVHWEISDPGYRRKQRRQRLPYLCYAAPTNAGDIYIDADVEKTARC